MRIAFVSQYFYPEQFSNNAIATHLASIGHDVDVLTAIPNYPKGEFFPGYSNQENRQEIWNGVQINRVRTSPRKSGVLGLVLNYFAFVFFGVLSAIFGRRKKPDVIFISQLSPVLMCIPAIVLKWRYRVPLVYWVQDIWPESAVYTLKITNPLVIKPLKWLCGWIYRRADIVLVQSAAFPPMIERFGVASHKIHIFPNTAPNSYKPLDPDPFSDIGKMVSQSDFNLMFAGNIGESQDFDTYLETAQRLAHRSELKWIIIGSGRDLDRVKAEVTKRSLTDRFLFLGRHPETTMPEFFSHADAMLVGLKDNAIFRLTVPYKVQCYMACGRPIVASLTGEGARIIEGANAGYVAPAQSPRLLAAAIEAMMETDERISMGQNGHNYYNRHYRSDVIYENLNNWLCSALEQID